MKSHERSAVDRPLVPETGRTLNERLLARPEFERVCSILSLFQREVSAQPDFAIRAEMYRRFSDLFLLGGFYYDESFGPKKQRMMTEAENDVIVGAINDAYEGTFVASTFARQVAAVRNGKLAEAVLRSWEQQDVRIAESEWSGPVVIANFRTEAREGRSVNVMEIHLKDGNTTDPLRYVSQVTGDLGLLKAYLLSLPKERLPGVVRMQSWLLAPKLHSAIRRIFGPSLARMVTHRPGDASDLLANDTPKYILSSAISSNTAAARAWITESILPEIGTLECPATEFIAAIGLQTK